MYKNVKVECRKLVHTEEKNPRATRNLEDIVPLKNERTNQLNKILDRFVTHNTKYAPFILVNGSALRHLVVHSLTLLLTCNAFIQSHPNQGIQTDR